MGAMDFEIDDELLTCFHQSASLKTGKRIDEGVMIYHFALEPESKQTASREQGGRNARVYFLVGKFGVVHVLFFDPYHEINP